MTDILEDAKKILSKCDLEGSQSRDQHADECHYWHPHCLVEKLVAEIERLRAEGWLTSEEREQVALAAEQAPESDFVPLEDGRHLRKVLVSLLERKPSPTVRLPEAPAQLDGACYDRNVWNVAMHEARKALVAAGVEVVE